MYGSSAPAASARCSKHGEINGVLFIFQSRRESTIMQTGCNVDQRFTSKDIHPVLLSFVFLTKIR